MSYLEGPSFSYPHQYYQIGVLSSLFYEWICERVARSQMRWVRCVGQQIHQLLRQIMSPVWAGGLWWWMENQSHICYISSFLQTRIVLMFNLIFVGEMAMASSISLTLLGHNYVSSPLRIFFLIISYMIIWLRVRVSEVDERLEWGLLSMDS